MAFVAEWRARDTARVGARARALAGAVRARLERDGLALASPPLLRCLEEGPDGTRLPGALKLYVEKWGMVFGVRRQNGRLVLRIRDVLEVLVLDIGHRREVYRR